MPLFIYGALMGHFKPTYNNKKQLNESDCGTIVAQIMFYNSALCYQSNIGRSCI